MNMFRTQGLLAAGGLACLTMLTCSAVAADKSISVADAAKEARVTGKPILAVLGTET